MNATCAMQAACGRLLPWSNTRNLLEQQRPIGPCTQPSTLPSCVRGKLQGVAQTRQTQHHGIDVRARGARRACSCMSEPTGAKLSAIDAQQIRFRLAPEVANMVPDDVDLDFAFEGDESQKGMLDVQALESQPELAALWHKAELRARPCLHICLLAMEHTLSGEDDGDPCADNLLIAQLSMFCHELEEHFDPLVGPNRVSLDCHVLSCLCLKVYWLVTALTTDVMLLLKTWIWLVHFSLYYVDVCCPVSCCLSCVM